ncbi:MAG: choice-of-anchor D domain-containing protein [Myxococcales bacterium]|nr:MAG: choice-of-anchor D domain-containing protein [Myxococcales bacterium]
MKTKRFVPSMLEWMWIAVVAVALCAACGKGESCVGCLEDGDIPEGPSDGDTLLCVKDADCYEAGKICAYDTCIPRDENPCEGNPTAECQRDTNCAVDRYCDENTCTCELIGGDYEDGDGPGDPCDHFTWCSCDKLPCIQIEPTVLGYGCAQYLESVRNTFNIRNRGNGTLEILSMEFAPLSSPDFKWADNQAPDAPILLEPGETLQFEVELTPTDPGVDQATIQIICNDLSRESGKFEVLLQSEYKGGSRIDVAPIDHNFGSAAAGQSVPLRVAVSNLNPDDRNGIDPTPPERCKLLTISDIEFDPPTTHYRLGVHPPFPIFVPPAGSFQFTLFYEPRGGGAQETWVRIFHDADRNPYNPLAPSMPVEVHLEGWGVAPLLNIEPDPVDFGRVAVGYRISIPVTLRGAAGGTIRMCGCEWRGAREWVFTMEDPTDACHAEIPPNGARTFWIDCQPTDERFYGGVLELCSNDLEEPKKLLPIECEGVEASLLGCANSNPILFGEVPVGEEATRTFEIVNDSPLEVVLQGVGFEYEGPRPGATSPFYLDSGDSALLPLTIPSVRPDGSPGVVSLTIHYIPVAQTPGWLDEATLVLSTNNPSQPTCEVSLSGTPKWPKCDFGVVDYPDFDGVIDFGEVRLGSSLTHRLRVSSTSNAPCEVISVNLLGSPYEFSLLPREIPPIPPAGHTDILITYAPVSSPGTDVSAILVETNDLRPGNRRFEAQLRGQAIAPLDGDLEIIANEEGDSDETPE